MIPFTGVEPDVMCSFYEDSRWLLRASSQLCLVCLSLHLLVGHLHDEADGEIDPDEHQPG